MESINGLPAHPLFVHAPVVLVPLTTLYALVLAARPSLRKKAGWGLAASAVITLVLIQMAVVSGYRFDEILDGAVITDDHAALAETSRNLFILFTLAVFGFVALDWRSRSQTIAWAETAARTGVVLGALLAVASTVWMVRAGDEGAKLVWSGVLLITPWG